MNEHEAAKILDVTPNSKPRQIDAAYSALRLKYVTRAQHSTAPSKRDEANKALALTQDAYRVLSGKNAPARIRPSRATTTAPSSSIPRASMHGAPHRARAPARRRFRAVVDKDPSPTSTRPGKETFSQSRNPTGKWCPGTIENKMAFVICSVMFFLALMILGRVLSCTR